MIFDPEAGWHLPAADENYDERMKLLDDLGLTVTSPELDTFATELATAAGAPYAMVNIFTHEQFFAGLHNPGEGEDLPQVDRTMPVTYGFCPEVFDLKIARVLPDVLENPRFASNPVVDNLGIRNYAGAPLIHSSGTTLGTICWVSPKERPASSGKDSLRLIKDFRDNLMDSINQRTGR